MGQDDVLAPLGPTKTHNSYLKAYLDSKVPVAVLRQDLLLDMGQGELKAYFNGEDSPPDRLWKISRIWQDLLTTTRSAAVTNGHLTAACNAICVFLESACSSSLPYIRDFGMSKETWLRCFGAILESFEEGKVKPMRQVLITLANILIHNPDYVVSSSIQKEVMIQLTGIILLGEAGHVKAALVAMELFIRRVSSFYEVLQSIEFCVNSRQVDWSRRLFSFGVEKAVCDLPVSASISGLDSTEPEHRTTIAFVTALLMALLSRDTQSAAIALYKTYSTALIGSGRGNHLYSMSTSKQEGNSSADPIENFKKTRQPPLIFLIQAFLEVHPAAITPFTDFLFPTVFKHDHNGYREYTDTLQKDDCNLINLLAVVQVGCQMGLEQGQPRLLFPVQNAIEWTKLTIPSDPALALTRTIRSSDVPSNRVYDIYKPLLSHAEADIRIRTFALLLASPSTTAPLPNAVLQLLTGHMKYLYGDSDAQSRGEVISMVRKLVIRLQGGACFLHKSMISSPSQPEGEATDNSFTDLRQHENFIVWFANFLEGELRPDVSYQRHIMALKSIDLLVRSGLDSAIGARMPTEISQDQTPWPINVSLHHASLTCALLNLVVDPFEDVRIVSSTLVEILDLAVVLPIQKSISDLLRSAEGLASQTGRADHADGAARLYNLHYALMQDSPLPGVASALPSKGAIVEEILNPLQAALASIEGDIDLPTLQISLHARLLGLKYILQDQNFPGDAYKDEALKSCHREVLVGRMIYLCQRVWQRVRARLCVDSPENAEDDLSEELSVGPKDILSYSWRALRDSSLLSCAILDMPIFRGRKALSHSSLKCLESIGLLCMDQLSNLRHRGAFSTVAQTFFVLCGRIGELNDSSAARLRDVWYESAVATIDQQATRLTRRSAGLPAMMVGLLHGCSQPFFDRFMESFKKRSRILNNPSELLSKSRHQQIELPQVHALNCLREVFTNARFRNITELHVIDMLNLAATSLSSDIWNIRNCGLMLFRACTSRLGRARTTFWPIVSQSRISEATISGDRARDVLELALNLLNPKCFLQGRSQVSLTLQSDDDFIAAGDQANSLVATERIFAALDLIGRISPSSHDADHIELLVLEKTSSKVWQVREQAARVCASRVSPWDALDLLGRIVSGMSVRKDQNSIHGRLLCVKQILRTLWWSRVEPLRYHLDGAASILKPLFAYVMAGNMSSVVRTTFLDIVNDAFEMEILSRSSADSSHLTFWIGEDLFGSTELSDGPGFPKHESAAVHESYQFFSTLSGREQNPPSNLKLRYLFLNLAKVDFDAAARFLARIASQHAWNQNIRNIINDLYQFIIPHDFFPEDIKSEAMADLTASIENKLFESGVLINETKIFRCLLHNVKPRGRNLRNAKLRLQANLFALGSPKALQQINSKRQPDISSWVTMLQDAAWDDIDTPTRLNAASSLLAFTPILLSEQLTPVSSSQYLQIYLLLYDLLNDDDEDVREIAGSAASAILSSGGTVSLVLIRQSPLAASEKLAFFLIDKFRNERHFCLAALKRIWFSSTSTQEKGSIEQEITKCSVKHLLESLQRDLNTLFEEEKQNLYIDDVREVETWSELLKSTEPPEEDYLNLLGNWILTGLRDLRDYLDNSVDFDGPLGLTSQANTLKLFVGVISLAGVMLDWANRESVQVQGPRFAGASNVIFSAMPTDIYNSLDEALPPPHWTICMSHELEALEKMGRRLCIHEKIVRKIEEIIKKQQLT